MANLGAGVDTTIPNVFNVVTWVSGAEHVGFFTPVAASFEGAATGYDIYVPESNRTSAASVYYISDSSNFRRSESSPSHPTNECVVNTATTSVYADVVFYKHLYPTDFVELPQEYYRGVEFERLDYPCYDSTNFRTDDIKRILGYQSDVSLIDSWIFFSNGGYTGFSKRYYLRAWDTVGNKYVYWSSLELPNISPATTNPIAVGALSGICVIGIT